jgi:anti-anti-sigma factor
MNNTGLSISEETKQGAYILRLEGEITKNSGDELLRLRNWESGLSEGETSLLLDFSKVTYINSAGIAALIRLFRMRSNGLYQSICFGLNYHYEKLFIMVGLNKYITIYPNEWIAFDRIKSDHL